MCFFDKKNQILLKAVNNIIDISLNFLFFICILPLSKIMKLLHLENFWKIIYQQSTDLHISASVGWNVLGVQMTTLFHNPFLKIGLFYNIFFCKACKKIHHQFE